VNLAFDIFQGVGIAAAAGIRPFLPGVVASGLALAKVQIHFDRPTFRTSGGPGVRSGVVSHSTFHFLQQAPFLIIMAVLALGLIGVEASTRGKDVDTGPGSWFSAACGAAVGALVFAGVLCQHGDAWWPGIIGGIVFAALGFLCFRPFLVRLRTRLDTEAASLGVPLVAEGAALVVALASALAPPAGVVAIVGLLVFRYLGRGRSDQKYAGLRILR
jgi:hypothetical protein